MDAMDKYGIKATIFVSTEQDPAPRIAFQPTAGEAALAAPAPTVDNGHEIGSHSRQHPCKRPDTEAFCSDAQRVRSDRIERRYPASDKAALRLDMVLSLRELRQLRVHPEEDCRSRLHCRAQLPQRSPGWPHPARPPDLGRKSHERRIHPGRAETGRRRQERDCGRGESQR